MIPTGLTTDQAAQLGNFEINIVGQAIQSEHILKNTAKEAFETYWQGVPVYAGASDLYYSGDFAAPVVTPENQNYTMMYVEDANVTGEAVVKGEHTVATIALSNVTAVVDNVVVMNDRNTVVMENCNFTLPAGGKLVVDNTGDTTTGIYMHNVTVNGVQITSANVNDYVETLGFVNIY